jgi:hypothetical protein
VNRPQDYSGEIPRSYDFLKGWRDAQIGVGIAISDLIGMDLANSAFGAQPLLDLDSTGVRAGITTGLVGSPTYGGTAVVGGFDYAGKTGFRITLSPGTVYTASDADSIGDIINGGGTPTGYGDISASDQVIVHECIVPQTQLTITASAPSGSNVLWYLITVTPTQEDTTDSDDPNLAVASPNNAILPYYSSANPNQPLAGPGGTNPPTQQPSSREAAGTLNVITATNTSTTTIPAGLAVPATDVPLYLGYLIDTDSNINEAHLWATGLGTCPTLSGSVAFQQAPFLRGITEQHHLGVAGSAPQIDGAVEWKPLATVPNNGQKINGVAGNTASAQAFGTNDYATINSQFAIQPSGSRSYTFGGTASGPTGISSISITGGLVACVRPFTGGLWLIQYSGILNFTTSSYTAPGYIQVTGNAHPSAVTSGGGLTGVLGVIATINQTPAVLGAVTDTQITVIGSANANASNPLTQFDFAIVLGGNALWANATYNYPFSILITAY